MDEGSSLYGSGFRILSATSKGICAACVFVLFLSALAVFAVRPLFVLLERELELLPCFC